MINDSIRADAARFGDGRFDPALVRLTRVGSVIPHLMYWWGAYSFGPHNDVEVSIATLPDHARELRSLDDWRSMATDAGWRPIERDALYGCIEAISTAGPRRSHLYEAILWSDRLRAELRPPFERSVIEQLNTTRRLTSPVTTRLADGRFKSIFWLIEVETTRYDCEIGAATLNIRSTDTIPIGIVPPGP